MDSSVFYYKITSFLETTERGCWPTKRRAYDLCRIIGFGSTAIVHEAYCKPRKERCAIKQINVQYPERKLKALKEIMIMKTCNHENIVKFYTSFMVDNEIWLVTNLSECGSLRDIIRHKMILHDFKDGVLDEETVATVLKQILKGLEYLHNNQIIHRDIKASNILINKNGSVQLADFGLSSILPTIESISQLKTFHLLAGTPSWMAPEIMQKKSGYDFKADIWSFGITAIEIITGDVPYLTFLPDEIIKLTLENDPPTLDANCHEKSGYNKYGNLVREMIACCLQKDPAKRPTAAELLEHPFFRKAKDNEFLLKRLSIWAPSLGLEIQSIVNAQLWYLKSKTKRRESLFMTERLTQSLSEEKEIFGTGKHLSKNNTNFKSQLAALCLEKYGESSTSQEYYTCQTVPITLPLIATYPSLPQRKGFPKKKLWKFLKKLGTSNS